MNNFLKKPAGIAGLTVLLVIFDQFTKYLAVLFLKDQDPFVILPGVFELHYLENRGAAFGMMQGQQTFFLIIGILVFAGVIYLFRHMSEEPKFWPIRLIGHCHFGRSMGQYAGSHPSRLCGRLFLFQTN